jgi:hypothetical protein
VTAQPTAATLEQFAHLVTHMWARTGHPAARLPESQMVHNCWNSPISEPPAWAVQAATDGQPAAVWCPIVNPDLTEADTP